METNIYKLLLKKNKIYFILAMFSSIIWIIFGFHFIINMYSKSDTYKTKLSIVAFSIAFILILILQIILHEMGHLVFGLLTGYTFLSFRIGNLMWMKLDGKIHFRRLSTTILGGFCLLSPPDMKDDNLPYACYLLGGVFMNGLISIICLPLYFICFENMVFSVLFGSVVFLSMGYALFNGIPRRLSSIDNDGFQVLSIYNNPKAIQAFWLKMKINEQVGLGIRIKDMPDEWFEMPHQSAMENSIIATHGVFVCNRVLDQKNFIQASTMIRELLELDTGMAGLYRLLLTMDLLYCELINENRTQVVNELLSYEILQFIEKTKNVPAVLRTKYTYALLAEHDIEKAETIRDEFVRKTAQYPYTGEVESELELMEYARQKNEA